MLLFDAPLTFREFMNREEVPLATVFREVLEWLSGREDAVLFGAQAINAYCEPARMTEDVDLLSTDAERLAADLRVHLSKRLHIAVRVREVVPGGFRIYQVKKPKNRHLVDVRQVDVLPEHRRIDGVAVVTPVELAMMKAQSIAARQHQPKGLSDRLDLHRLLLHYPDLRERDGAVAERLRVAGADEKVLAVWREIVRERIDPDEDLGY